MTQKKPLALSCDDSSAKKGRFANVYTSQILKGKNGQFTHNLHGYYD
jgi:hypothetical protein